MQQENKRSSFPWISVNFDGWDFGWTREQEGIRGISPEEGEEVFTRSLQMRTEGAIIISTQALDHRMAQWIYFKEAGAEEGKAIKQRRYERPVLGTAYVAPESAMERVIAEAWQGVLKVEKIGIHDNFFELGGHSLLATQLMSRMREALQTTVTMRQFFEAPTIAALAAVLAGEQGRSLATRTTPITKIDRGAKLPLDSVKQLSDSEVDSLLGELLGPTGNE